jgi:phage-related protein
MTHERRPLFWVGSSRDDLKRFPADVRDVMGYALHLAQCGERHGGAKALRGFGSAGVVEIVDDYDRATFRTVYTVTFADAVYVLHAFQKKSKRGVATPQRDIELIKARLRRAEEHYERWQRERNSDAT